MPQLHPDRVDVAGMRGECERRQVWGWNDAADQIDVTVEFESLAMVGPVSPDGKTPVAATNGTTIGADHWSYTQQGYVHTVTSGQCKRSVPFMRFAPNLVVPHTIHAYTLPTHER